MNQDDVTVLLKKKQQARRDRDEAVQTLLRKHFQKLHFLEHSDVQMAAQTAAIINTIRRIALMKCCGSVDKIVDNVEEAETFNDEDEEEGGVDCKKEDNGEGTKEEKDEEDESEESNDEEEEEAKKKTPPDYTFLSEDIRHLVVAMDNQLEEHCKVLQIPSNYSTKFKESLKECHHAADQLEQQKNLVEEQSLENSIKYFDSLSEDEHKGGTARLVQSIEINVQSVEEKTRKLQAEIATTRKEFFKASELDGLLEVAPHRSYEKVRDTFAHIRRVSQKKSDENTKMWREFENKCREKQFTEMRRTYEMYVGSSDPLVSQVASEKGIQSFESKLKEHRVQVNHRLKDFHKTVIDISNRNIDKITSDADMLLTWRNKIIPWELKEQQHMESWLDSSVKDVEDKYSHVTETLRDQLSHLLGQIDALEFHRQKLTHLRQIPLSKQQIVRNRTGKFPKSTPVKSTTRMATGEGATSKSGAPAVTMEGIPIPDNSLRLGSRTVSLGRNVSIEDDELVLLLSQMIGDSNPDLILTKRLQSYLGHYAKVSRIRKNAGK